MVYSKIINENLPKALYKISNKIINKGRGCWLYDIDGNKILDFTSGIGVTSLGHNNKEVINTVKLQISETFKFLENWLKSVTNKNCTR